MIDEKTIYSLASDVKKLVSDFNETFDDIKLLEFLKFYSDDHKNLILSQFDRFKISINFKFHGLRYKNNSIKLYSFGYSNIKEVEELYDKDSFQYFLCKKFIGKIVEAGTNSKIKLSLPSTFNMGKIIRLASAAVLSNSDSSKNTYSDILEVKSIVNTIREKGFSLQLKVKLLSALNRIDKDKINDILKLFDSSNLTKSNIVYKVGVRYYKNLNTLEEVVIVSSKGKEFIYVPKNFIYNIFTLPKTKEIISILN